MNKKASSVDLSLLSSTLEKYHNRKRDALLPMLHEAQAVYGWLPRAVQEAIAHTLHVPLAEIHGVIEFYTMFYSEPTARRVIRVCEDITCQLKGCGPVHKAIEAKLGLSHGETNMEMGLTYERVPCLGMCEHAPSALNGSQSAGSLSLDNIDAFLAGTSPAPLPKVYGDPLLKLKRAATQVDATNLALYEAHEGYDGLRKAMTMTPEAVIEIVEGSGVLGRGGAMFPTGLKWKLTRRAPGSPSEKHIIANADESEPGTFKDRALMEADPFSLVEAMTVAAYAVGAENGWDFCSR